ncbi:hypothetical protein Ahy_A06g027187 [Arachis hypogaea]|uniref:Uncharacterized protein n=1 Tax=Arachis hypogaea TaxID=3818 RepID=A0A445CMZ9_ARAHY|nr:hypothetical protein Ahy_A06g027187 [Arachis hypogaea]
MRRFSFDIICKFSFGMDPECFIHFSLEGQVDRQFRPLIQAISIASNVVVAAYMKTKAITEHWFKEKVEGSNQSGRQYDHRDYRAEEEGDGNDDKYLRDIVINFLSMNWLKINSEFVFL